jgi:hypothetical protein
MGLGSDRAGFAVVGNGHMEGMWVAGIEMPAGAVAELALRLEKAGHHALGQRVGIAYDTNRPRLGLFRSEYRLIASVLGDASGALAELRETLLGTPPQRKAL